MAREHTYRIDGAGNTITRALSPREAIVAHCCECMGYEAGRSTRCSSALCALFPFSPFGDGSRRGLYAVLGKGGDDDGDTGAGSCADSSQEGDDREG